MSHALAIDFNGARLLADASGAVFWQNQRTLAVADLHFEKATSFGQHGTLLPPYDTRTTLGRLEALVDRYRPARIICLGDSFHDRGAFYRLDKSDRDRLCRIVAAVEWVWIAGNHDPDLPPELGGLLVKNEWRLADLTFRHCAQAGTGAGEVSGHYHPKARLVVRSHQLRGRCFLIDGKRLILPAFGAFAGGLDITDPVLDRLFPDGCTVHFIGRNQISTFSRSALVT